MQKQGIIDGDHLNEGKRGVISKFNQIERAAYRRFQREMLNP